jgi:hypothetical protein
MTQPDTGLFSEEVEVEELQDDELAPFKYSITSYGADYPIDGLVKRLKTGSIHIPTFQRGYVWKVTDASRFIESLLLGLPVPGIFLAKEGETNKLLVIDGQQRLRSLQYFYDGIFQPTGKIFALDNVQPQFVGVTYKTLADEDRRRLDDAILHATVIKQDEPSDDDSSIYYIFERLNTGGTLLSPQEIRACIYHGPFVDLLKDLGSNEHWRALFGAPSPRVRDQELILRFIALYYDPASYSRPMKDYLNRFMGKNRKLEKLSGRDVRGIFEGTVDVIHTCLGKKAFKPKRALNAAIFDAVMVGVARRLAKGAIKECASVQEAYASLLQSDEFVRAAERATADEENIKVRLRLATEHFADVQ